MNNKIFHNLSAAVAAGLALPYSKILKTREFSTQNKMNRLFAGKKRAVAELFILQQLLSINFIHPAWPLLRQLPSPKPWGDQSSGRNSFHSVSACGENFFSFLCPSSLPPQPLRWVAAGTLRIAPVQKIPGLTSGDFR